MNQYELMCILSPLLSDEEFKNVQNKYTHFITENGGEIVHSNPWGLKSLPYPIQKKTTAIYWVLEFSVPATLIEKLKIQILRDDIVLRHMITKLNKHAVEYNYKRRNGLPTGIPKKLEA